MHLLVGFRGLRLRELGPFLACLGKLFIFCCACFQQIYPLLLQKLLLYVSVGEVGSYCM